MSKVKVFKEIIYISQSKCFNISVELKYPSTFIALKYSIYIKPKGMRYVKKFNYIRYRFFSLNTIQIMFYYQTIKKIIDRFELHILKYVKILFFNFKIRHCDFCYISHFLQRRRSSFSFFRIRTLYSANF